ncbi:protein ALP1-like [Gadus morhua]|uniref:protein ALP1-like n=1 Tax=Gadus morhua TaxID=8049 RepID=UPI0011B6AD37|nr:protein ALP1-like [Gadus morhua]
MVSTYMPVPGAEDWMKIAGDYEKLADFPNCLSAIDGKHVVIQAPPSTGSQYFNYKGAFSIVLLAVVDARYRFRVVDVGAYGRSSDGGTLSSSAFGTALRLGNLDLPPDRPLPGAGHLGPQPHVFIGDEAFPLRRNLLRPYPGQNLGGERRSFNFQLSHGRRIVECAFGSLANQWRLYRSVLGVSPEVAESAVKATCILHNYMRWDGEGEDGPRTPTVPSQGAEHPQGRQQQRLQGSGRSEGDLQPLFLISAWSNDLAGWNLVYHFFIYLNQKRRKTKTNN